MRTCYGILQPFLPGMKNTSKKIFLVVTEINFFYSHRYALIKKLSSMGWQFYIISYFKDAKPQDEKNINYIFIGSNREVFGILNLLKNSFTLSKLIRLKKPDLIYAISHRSIFLARMASLFSSTKLIFAITGMGSLFTSHPNILKRTFLISLKYVVLSIYRFVIRSKKSYFILQNADDLNLLIEKSISTKEGAFIVPGNGLPDAYFSYIDAPLNKFNFIMIARLLRDKGVIEFLSAAKLLSKEFKDCQFTLYGDYDLTNPQAINQSEIEGYLSDNIVYAGYESNIRNKIIDSNIVVLPSYREGFARVLMEAQACARPVITSDISGCRDVIVDKSTGFLVKSMDSHDLASKMRFFLENPNIYTQMSKNSYEHARNKFTISQAADHHAKIFNKILLR
jgi:glycosyltransferase involved in cell wall biosynthesis